MTPPFGRPVACARSMARSDLFLFLHCMAVLRNTRGFTCQSVSLNPAKRTDASTRDALVHASSMAGPWLPLPCSPLILTRNRALRLKV